MGLAWLFRRRRKPQEAPAADPAGELKQKLAETRGGEPELRTDEAEAEAKGPPLDERRRAVHDRARASIDEMRGRGSPPAD